MRRFCFLVWLIALVLTGCDDNFLSSQTSGVENSHLEIGDNIVTTTKMIINEEYVIEKGDTIVRDDPDTEIDLITSLEDGETVAILRRGKAHIE